MDNTKQHTSIVFSSSISDMAERNSSFDTAVLRVCYVGENRNKSSISKEVMLRCMDTIYNVPIVCRYDRELDEIGSHDMELVRDDKGRMCLVNITHPVGVVPEGANTWFEEIEDDSGVHEYLCTDVLIWKRQEAYDKIKRNGITAESMEISINSGKMIDGIFVIDDFEFTAFCLLEADEPCYESASLEFFADNGFKTRLDEMLRDFACYKQVSTIPDTPEVVDDISENTKVFSEGGDESMEVTNNNQEVIKPVEPTVETPAQENPTGNFALAEQLRAALIEALRAETVEREWGTMQRYWYVDHDAELSEVYAEDGEDWHLYGFSYAMNGDNAVVDFSCKKRKKFVIADYDEGEQPAFFAAVSAKMTEQFENAKSAWDQERTNLEQSIEAMSGEVEELKQFKMSAENAKLDSEKDGVLGNFDDLNGVEAFETLRANKHNYSVEDLEEKCFAIRGRKNTAKFSADQKPVKIPVAFEGDTSEPYGGIFEKYGIRK